ncbi:MAG: CHASE2 domain-containing protein [Bacteroidaceae bacterium]|nr:CHASE2 domain-containing protein [Bacteroidales bacterium]MBP5771798.1 CHASE2 domain-containing protein [Bacteroidaceae bacterium]
MNFFRKFRYLVIALFAFLVVGFYAMVTFNLSFMGPIQRALKNFSMADIYTQILQSTGAPDTSRVITIVDMTDLMARSDLAQALEEIMAFEPKAVGVDIVFEGLKEDTASDRWLVDIAKTYDNIVWQAKLLDYQAEEQTYKDKVQSFFIEEAQPKEGFANMPRDLYEGLKRTVALGESLNGKTYTSFSLLVANTYAGTEVAKTQLKDININYRPTEFRTIHAFEVMEHPELIQDHIVLFGAMKDEHDMHYTTLGKIPGVEVLAYAVQTLINKNSIKELPTWLTWLISIFIVMITSWALTIYKNDQLRRRKSPFMRTFMTSLMVIGYIKFVWMAILTFIGFMLFNFFSISLNLGWAFSGIAFIATAEGFYKAIFEPEKG